MRLLFIFCFFFGIMDIKSQADYYKIVNGSISIVSKAPKEVIKAKSNRLNGIINVANNNFSFKVLMITFEGFNSPLQQEHFHENYMETSEFPEATFVGKIIESIDFNKKQNVRAKGILTVHGVAHEIIIAVKLDVIKNQISFETNFIIELDDFNINVPKLVNQKIARKIDVFVKGELKKEN